MSLNPEMRERMLHDTRDAAAAFLEDIEHLRETATRASSRRDSRHISAILRRLLVDDDLRAIAAPRVGRVKIRARCTNDIYARFSGKPIILFTFGGRVFSRDFGTVTSWPNDYPVPSSDIRVPVRDMNIDNFLSQKVLALRGEWASRREVIKYVANDKSGVHSNHGEKEVGRLLAKLELSASYQQAAGPLGMPMMTFNNTDKLPPLVTATYTKDTLNPVLVEIFSTAYLLARSPDVARLEASLRQEFK